MDKSALRAMSTLLLPSSGDVTVDAKTQAKVAQFMPSREVSAIFTRAATVTRTTDANGQQVTRRVVSVEVLKEMRPPSASEAGDTVAVMRDAAREQLKENPSASNLEQ